MSCFSFDASWPNHVTFVQCFLGVIPTRLVGLSKHQCLCQSTCAYPHRAVELHYWLWQRFSRLFSVSEKVREVLSLCQSQLQRSLVVSYAVLACLCDMEREQASPCFPNDTSCRKLAAYTYIRSRQRILKFVQGGFTGFFYFGTRDVTHASTGLLLSVTL